MLGSTPYVSDPSLGSLVFVRTPHSRTSGTKPTGVSRRKPLKSTSPRSSVAHDSSLSSHGPTGRRIPQPTEPPHFVVQPGLREASRRPFARFIGRAFGTRPEINVDAVQTPSSPSGSVFSSLVDWEEDLEAIYLHRKKSTPADQEGPIVGHTMSLWFVAILNFLKAQWIKDSGNGDVDGIKEAAEPYGKGLVKFLVRGRARSCIPRHKEIRKHMASRVATGDVSLGFREGKEDETGGSQLGDGLSSWVAPALQFLAEEDIEGIKVSPDVCKSVSKWWWCVCQDQSGVVNRASFVRAMSRVYRVLLIDSDEKDILQAAMDDWNGECGEQDDIMDRVTFNDIMLGIAAVWCEKAETSEFVDFFQTLLKASLPEEYREIQRAEAEGLFPVDESDVVPLRRKTRSRALLSRGSSSSRGRRPSSRVQSGSSFASRPVSAPSGANTINYSSNIIYVGDSDPLEAKRPQSERRWRRVGPNGVVMTTVLSGHPTRPSSSSSPRAGGRMFAQRKAAARTLSLSGVSIEMSPRDSGSESLHDPKHHETKVDEKDGESPMEEGVGSRKAGFDGKWEPPMTAAGIQAVEDSIQGERGRENDAIVNDSDDVDIVSQGVGSGPEIRGSGEEGLEDGSDEDGQPRFRAKPPPRSQRRGRGRRVRPRTATQTERFPGSKPVRKSGRSGRGPSHPNAPPRSDDIPMRPHTAGGRCARPKSRGVAGSKQDFSVTGGGKKEVCVPSSHETVRKERKEGDIEHVKRDENEEDGGIVGVGVGGDGKRSVSPWSGSITMSPLPKTPTIPSSPSSHAVVQALEESLHVSRAGIENGRDRGRDGGRKIIRSVSGGVGRMIKRDSKRRSDAVVVEPLHRRIRPRLPRRGVASVPPVPPLRLLQTLRRDGGAPASERPVSSSTYRTSSRTESRLHVLSVLDYVQRATPHKAPADGTPYVPSLPVDVGLPPAYGAPYPEDHVMHKMQEYSASLSRITDHLKTRRTLDGHVTWR